MSKRLLAMITSLMTLVVLCGAPAVAFAYDGNVLKKEETVYVVTDSDGTQNDVIVSDHLANDKQLESISDETNLSDIENVKGNETFKRDGKNLTWAAKGRDIYYQGKTESEIPVKLDVTYKLDGKEVSGSDLQGKSGDLEIHIDYTNNGRYEGNTVPFIVMTGMIITNDSFKKISIDHGKIVDDGEKQVVIGMAAPGLAESLDIGEEDLGFGDSITIRGTADKFDVKDMMTIATNSVFGDIDSDAFGDLNYDEQIKQLDNGAKKLVKGSKELNEGLNMLDGNIPQLKSGVDQLNSGAGSLLQGAKKMKAGSDALYKGLLAVKAGLGDTDSTTSMTSVLAGVKTGLDTAATNLANSIALSKGAKQEVDGVGDNLGTASTALGAALGSLADPQISGKDTVKSDISSAKSKLNGISKDGMTDSQKQAIDEAISALNTAEGDADKISVSGLNDTKGQVDAAKKIVDGSKAVLTVQGNGEGNYSTSKKLELSLTIQNAINSSMTNSDETGLLKGILGAQTINNTILGKMGDEETDGTIINGAYAISTGLGNNEQKPGTRDMTTGAQQLADGLSQLSDKSDTLADGVDQLDNGSLQLSNGMSKLYKEGIKKIVDMYNNDLKGMVDGMDNVMDAGKGYKTFTKLPNNMDGNVKFIYKTAIF